MVIFWRYRLPGGVREIISSLKAGFLPCLKAAKRMAEVKVLVNRGMAINEVMRK